MGIHWNPWEVSKALDEIEQALDKAEPFLRQANESIERARKIPNLPGYLDKKLGYVAMRLGRFDENVRDSVRRAREDIPQKDIQKAQAAATQQRIM